MIEEKCKHWCHYEDWACKEPCCDKCGTKYPEEEMDFDVVDEMFRYCWSIGGMLPTHTIERFKAFMDRLNGIRNRMKEKHKVVLTNKEKGLYYR